MLEREGFGNPHGIEIKFDPSQDATFVAKRFDDGWKLIVNRNSFIARGFTSNDLDGAIALEEECLNRQTQVSSVDEVEGLNKWQGLSSDAQTVAFKSTFERLAAFSSLERQGSPKVQVARKYLEKFAYRVAGNSELDQLFTAILRKGLGEQVEFHSDVAQQVFVNLDRPENVNERQVSPLESLISSDLSYGAKASWFEARFLPRLDFLKNRDQFQREQEVKNIETQQRFLKANILPIPPPAVDEYEQHRGREEKGKGEPSFVVTPGLTGYWESDSFDTVVESSGALKKSDHQRAKSSVADITTHAVDKSIRQIHLQSGTRLINIPLLPGFLPTQIGIDQLRDKGVEIFTDSEGHIFIRSFKNQFLDIDIAQATQSSFSGTNFRDTGTVLQVPLEIETQLDQLIDLAGTTFEKVARWQDFIHEFFRYPNDDQVEHMYSNVDNSPNRLNAMYHGKLLDCYLAREFFIAGFKRIGLNNIEWRAVNGFYVASKEHDGASHLYSGNAHAWVKIREMGDKNWTIFDPTPAGDPIHKDDGSMEGFGELSTNPLSDKDIQLLKEEAKGKEERRKKLTQETQDHYLMQFARQAGISPGEASKILSVLRSVDQMKDKQGRPILSRLKEQFDRIVEYYTQETQEYFGLVEMSRGIELDDPVSATIDIRSGNLDPIGFRRKRIIVEEQEYYGGVDLEIVADGSSSMTSPVYLGGVAKYLMQRNMSYLLHRALHRFSQDAQRRKFRLVTPLKIRSSGLIFRGNSIEEIKPLSDEFTPVQMALLWKKSAENIGGGTPAHLGLQAVIDRIPPEEVQLLKNKKLLKVVALISDGDYDDSTRVLELIKIAQDMNIIVSEFHIDDSDSLEKLPQNVAEKFIEATKIIMPERVKR